MQEASTMTHTTITHIMTMDITMTVATGTLTTAMVTMTTVSGILTTTTTVMTLTTTGLITMMTTATGGPLTMTMTTIGICHTMPVKHARQELELPVKTYKYVEILPLLLTVVAEMV